MNKLRLLLFPDCNRVCVGCCNKDWDIDNLPVCSDFAPYDEVLLTGGEPMLSIGVVHNAIRRIRKTSGAAIYVYTADVRHLRRSRDVLSAADGMCVTLHEDSDVADWVRFATNSSVVDLAAHRSCRLNVFSGIELPRDVPPGWQVKSGIEWIEKFPLPENEVFMRWHGVKDTP